jgi:fucose 4-O-acetylase-like acetyltransferase
MQLKSQGSISVDGESSASIDLKAQFKAQLSETLYWIRGVAIMLVVIGHVIGFDRDYGMRQYYNSDLSWLGLLGDIINTVHMPTFFIASGLATDFFSRKVGSYGDFFTTKLPRLLLPLVCWAPPFFILQSLIKNQPITLRDIFSAIYEPYQIFWFLHALIFAVTLHFLMRRLSCPKWFYFGFSVLLMGCSFLPKFDSFMIYGYWNFFFSFGILLSGPLPKLDRWLWSRSRWTWAGIMLLCIATILTAKALLPSLSQLFILRLITGIPGFILLYLTCGLSKRGTDRIALPILHSSVAYLGIMSMVIYLFHGYFTRMSSLIITKFLGQIAPMEYFLILSVMGITIPLLLNLLILRKNRILSYITGGK